MYFINVSYILHTLSVQTVYEKNVSSTDTFVNSDGSWPLGNAELSAFIWIKNPRAELKLVFIGRLYFSASCVIIPRYHIQRFAPSYIHSCAYTHTYVDTFVLAQRCRTFMWFISAECVQQVTWQSVHAQRWIYTESVNECVNATNLATQSHWEKTSSGEPDKFMCSLQTVPALEQLPGWGRNCGKGSLLKHFVPALISRQNTNCSLGSWF